MPNYKRLGETVQLPYVGDTVTFADNSVFKVYSAKALPYSSTYADLLTEMPTLVTSAVNMNGHLAGGFWDSFNQQYRIIIGPTSGTWILISYDTTYYWTSADSGSTWTARSYPVVGKQWIGLYDGTNYVLYANNSTTNGVYESTDGINWTSRTAVSISPVVRDLIYNGSIYLAFPAGGGSTCATSPDRINWTSRTLALGSTNQVFPSSCGNVTWNSGAGLFVAGSQTARTYQTSPDGATWTSRLMPDFILNTVSSLFASNSTTTVCIGIGGVCATSTDGINWTQRELGADIHNISGNPIAIYWDGSKFAVHYNGIQFYSVDGITWTKATRANVGSISGTAAIKTPIGFLGIMGGYGLHVTDVASTANTSIALIQTSTIAVVATYMCIFVGDTGGSGGSGGLTTTEHNQLMAIPTNPLLATDVRIDGIKSKTDQLVFTSGNLNSIAQVVADKTGYSLTTAEKTAIANEVENQIIDDTDSEKVLTAITNKIASVNPSLDDLTLAGIASAVRTELGIELARIDMNISDVSLGGGGGGGLTQEEHDRLFGTATKGDVSFSPAITFEEKQAIFKSLNKILDRSNNITPLSQAIENTNKKLSGLAKKEDVKVNVNIAPDERISAILQAISGLSQYVKPDENIEKMAKSLDAISKRELDKEAIGEIHKLIKNMPVDHIDEVKGQFMDKIQQALGEILSQEILKSFMKESMGALFDKMVKTEDKTPLHTKLFDLWASKQ